MILTTKVFGFITEKWNGLKKNGTKTEGFIFNPSTSKPFNTNTLSITFILLEGLEG
jgi:hypothetical protein